jgi:hypothetical protein
MQAVARDWIAAMLEAKGLLRETLCIQVFVDPQTGGRRPRVVGYKVAENVRAQLEDLCGALGMSAMWEAWENLASASVSVKGARGWMRMCTLEELLNDPAAWAAWDARAPLP